MEPHATSREPGHEHPHPDHGHSEHGDPLDAAHALAHADVWLSDVTAGYGDRLALEHVTVAVEPGSLLAVVGPNGAGKSTLLKLMAGLVGPVARPGPIPWGPPGPAGRPGAHGPPGAPPRPGLPAPGRGGAVSGPVPP